MEHQSTLNQLTTSSFMERPIATAKRDTIIGHLKICLQRLGKSGVHSTMVMTIGSFYYTGKDDTARCDLCNLEVSGWTVDMKPFNIHQQRSPNCPFVQAMQPKEKFLVPLTITSNTTELATSDREKPSKRRKTEESQEMCSRTILNEVDLQKQTRKRTFSHWPHRTSPSSVQMVEAGFFNCNVGDRVICLYCNLICQQWVPNTDDPWEAHKTLSPKCPYFIATLKRQQTSSIPIVNEQSTRENGLGVTDNDPLRLNEIVYTAACHPAYIEIPKRHASFAAWPNENSPSVDDLVRAGFFYTGTKTIVTCFYCNGSLQNWGSNDNPMIEHARWFPHCAYAKQLCGDELYQKIQESKCAQQERVRVNEARNKSSSGVTMNTNVTTNSGQLLIPDENTLSTFVAAGLDLPISQRLLDQGFTLSVIRRCWEDQLRQKGENFVSDVDLYVACLILQKQIEHVDGKKENIVIPRLKMKHFRECEDKEGNTTDFIEERTKTIEREKSFIAWPHASPSRRDIFTSGWFLHTTKGRDLAICPYCGVENDNWESTDNPLRIHRGWSPSCPFVLSEYPMHPSSIPIQRLDQVFTPERIATEAVKTTSNVILTSNSPYAQPPKRAASFSTFPNGPPPNVDALIRSGFYYRNINTLLQCYSCAEAVNDFHQYPANEINQRHRDKFPHCRFAQLLLRQDETRSTNNTDRCTWCSINPKERATYPCMDLAVCDPCAQLISLCPVCSIEAKAFVRLYIS